VKRFLKLTGGSFAGRKLYVPDIGVRPATNLVREALFSTLNSFYPQGVAGLKILDLFAGTGSLGLEAISRGASKVTFVDRSGESVRSIRKNLKVLSFSGEVYRIEVKAYLKKSKSLDYDLVFMDPPYRFKSCGKIVEHLKRALIPREMQILVHERLYVEVLPCFGDEILLLKRKKYGQTELLYYRL